MLSHWMHVSTSVVDRKLRRQQGHDGGGGVVTERAAARRGEHRGATEGAGGFNPLKPQQIDKAFRPGPLFAVSLFC